MLHDSRMAATRKLRRSICKPDGCPLWAVLDRDRTRCCPVCSTEIIDDLRFKNKPMVLPDGYNWPKNDQTEAASLQYVKCFCSRGDIGILDKFWTKDQLKNRLPGSKFGVIP